MDEQLPLPEHIVNDPNLGMSEKIVLSEIYSWNIESEGLCFASNKYIAYRIGLSTGMVSKIICSLRKRGYIEDVSFRGRKRVMRLSNYHQEANDD